MSPTKPPKSNLYMAETQLLLIPGDPSYK
uniref:Uncharacterized protein n=1 Tax=Rhizophora mucronata TaxID=61149 RepID=A0A2P2JBI6_RHIMU